MTDQFICRFHQSGFPHTDPTLPALRPCNTRYHLSCIRVGAPFRTRLRDNGGLSMPPLPDFPNFICELCTVRSVLDRELHIGGPDTVLLAYERSA